MTSGHPGGSHTLSLVFLLARSRGDLTAHRIGDNLRRKILEDSMVHD